MSAHTPGQWNWEEGTPVITKKWDGKTCTVATVDWRSLLWHEDGNCAGRESGANARLIAAAPELLEALQNLLAVAGVRIDDPRIVQFDAARAAVAKATGETK